MDISSIHELFLASNGVTTDTRKITNNTLFFALKGANFNGNHFAEKAISLGASYAFVDEKAFATTDKCILVADVLKTLQALANFHRLFLKTPIIALTGSNGKTTTKELINAVVSQKFNTTATLGNLNNHIGVPLTLLAMNKDTEIGIVEMGANHQKEIELLAKITEPDYGYITNFGKAHIEGFGSIEGVVKGKSELYENLKLNNKTAFVNSNDQIQVEKTRTIDKILFGNECEIVASEPFLSIVYKGRKIKTQLIGDYNLPNINAAICMGEHFGVPLDNIVQGIENYLPTNSRSQVILKHQSTIILDAYNANPTSMEAALKNLAATSDEEKFAILGDMFELGSIAAEEHEKIANQAMAIENCKVVLVGKNFFNTKASKAEKFQTFEAFKKSFIPNKGTYLIKGSRGMALERIIELFD